jgi:hypothetical protein
MPTTTKEDVLKLQKIFESISIDYGRYLSVFSIFDPNSLGTISEVLLTKLLQNKGIDTIHTGAKQGLTDLIVNGHKISLKTTDSTNKIGLGSSSEETDDAAAQKISTLLRKNNINEVPVESLQGKIPDEDYKLIINRLDAIASKLTGEGNEEFFVWVEKVKKEEIISELKIHIIKYDKVKTMNTFIKNLIYTTPLSWGIKHAVGGNYIIQSDLKSKLLNIHPDFVRRSSVITNPINIILQKSELPKIDLEKIISSKLFKSLDSIYSDIFGSEEKTD